MRNPLQDQLLKAGLVKKNKVTQVVREQNKKRHGKASPNAAPEADAVDAQKLLAERVERDRALSAERNAQARANELKAQVRQIVEMHRVKREGEIDYRFTDGNAIRSVLVNEALRAQLAKGALVIVRHGDSHELVPRAAAEKIRERDPEAIVLDHGRSDDTSSEADENDDFYSQFKVPDDLVW
ncbi:DUF2058 domain-containing protein [Lysobacter sp. A03]|uniref:DUF2058 domain-containing protein n=1 Tax=Lysobacter sp. A03 TaxID=1199154 RepID=UPI0005B6BF1F|nr:DUF2058 domain-containing protein [Lysobacter sp. A03]KIQ96542.1 nucleoprotein/polynucleotide-associated enzyme [Lysobacter sp. A03]